MPVAVDAGVGCPAQAVFANEPADDLPVHCAGEIEDPVGIPSRSQTAGFRGDSRIQERP
jgi:hypothetical protein